MTTIYEKKARCAVCGFETAYAGIGSTNALGPPDLDTRPPEMKIGEGDAGGEVGKGTLVKN